MRAFASSLAPDRLGASLLRSGLIDQPQLGLAESRYHPTTRFGEIVVEQGMLTPRELWNGVKDQVEEIVRSLFSYTAGWIHFWKGEIEPDNVVRLSLPTRRLAGHAVIESGPPEKEGASFNAADDEDCGAFLEAVDPLRAMLIR